MRRLGSKVSAFAAIATVARKFSTSMDLPTPINLIANAKSCEPWSGDEEVSSILIVILGSQSVLVGSTYPCKAGESAHNEHKSDTWPSTIYRVDIESNGPQRGDGEASSIFMGILSSLSEIIE